MPAGVPRGLRPRSLLLPPPTALGPPRALRGGSKLPALLPWLSRCRRGSGARPGWRCAGRSRAGQKPTQRCRSYGARLLLSLAAWGDSGWAAGARGLVWSARYCSAEGNGCLFGVKDDASVRVYIFSAWSRYFHFWNFVPLTNACHVCAEKPSVDFHFVARVRAHVAFTCTCGRWLNT